MKTKLLILGVVISSAAAAVAAGGRNGAGNANRGGGRVPPASCDLSGPGQGTPLRDGSGRLQTNRGNPDRSGTPLRDGSGRASAPGKGPRDGSGGNPNCPVAPKPDASG